MSLPQEILKKRLLDGSFEDLISVLDARYVKQSEKANSNPEKEFMDVPECAELTGYKPDYIRQLVFHKRIPFYKPGRLLRFLRHDIIEWMTANKFTPTAQRANDFVEKNNYSFIKNRKNHDTKSK